MYKKPGIICILKALISWTVGPIERMEMDRIIKMAFIRKPVGSKSKRMYPEKDV